jgi:RNA polymerase sigma-70 factor (ECF subfamily)
MTVMTTDAIWKHLSADLRHFIGRRVSDQHVADDLLQETFVRVHRNLGSLQDANRMAAWVYQIARNVVRDHHRKNAVATTELADLDPADEHDGNDVFKGDLQCRGAGWMDEMIRTLPDGYREAVQLAEMDCLLQQEVANRLGLSLSGAKSRIQRGRAMLRDVLERCCHFEFDGRGHLLDCAPKPDRTVCRNGDA